MKKINESELKELTTRLNNKLVETQQINEVDWAGLASKGADLVKAGAQKAGQWIANNPGKAGLAAGAALGAGGAAAAQAATGKKWPTTPEEIKAFQTANKLKVDGLIGQNTLAALTQQGYTPPQGFKPVANKAAGSQAAAPAGTTAPQSDPELDALNAKIAGHQQYFDQRNAANAQPSVFGADGKVTGMPPAVTPNNPAAATAPGQTWQQGVQANQALMKQMQDTITPNFASQKATPASAAPQPSAAPQTQNAPYSPNVSDVVVYKESVGYDEVDRIISLVHYR